MFKVFIGVLFLDLLGLRIIRYRFFLCLRINLSILNRLIQDIGSDGDGFVERK